MTPTLHNSAGIILVFFGWLATRRGAAALAGFDRWLLLDAALPATVFALLLALSARPLFSGALTMIFGAGFAYAERAKRRTLGEPIVFTDVFQTIDIFRHPRLAMPFPNRLPIVLFGAFALSAFAALYGFEAAVPALRAPLPIMALLATPVAAAWLSVGPLNRKLAQALRRDNMTGEPFDDAARFGTLATLLGYGIVARAERSARRKVAAPLPQAARAKPNAAPASVILVQCESFFDARRLGASIVPDLLPCFDRLSGESLQSGRLGVPCWGANTVRTEFAVLSGLTEGLLGMDRFNPYYRFARQPLDSLAARLRAQGYRTVCIHPFDGRFYARREVLPHLGFDIFIGEEAFRGAPRVGGFVADLAIPPVVETLIAEARQPLFVFVITLENHGPWTLPLPGGAPLLAPGAGLPLARDAALERYLASLRNSDAMLAALSSRIDDGRLIGFYGDHQPGPPLTDCSRPDNRSDYLIWRAGWRGGGQRVDLAAHELGAALLRAASGPGSFH